MTKQEFAALIEYLQAGCGKAATPQQIEVYFDLLADLEFDVAKAAARQALLRHRFASLPPVGLIREFAVELNSPTMTGAEAWPLFLSAVKRYGGGIKRHFRAGREPVEMDMTEIGLESLPPRVRRAAKCFGWKQLCDTDDEHIGMAQARFVKLFAELADREQDKALMPPSVQAIAGELANGFTEHERPALPAVKP